MNELIKLQEELHHKNQLIKFLCQGPTTLILLTLFKLSNL